MADKAKDIAREAFIAKLAEHAAEWALATAALLVPLLALPLWSTLVNSFLPLVAKEALLVASLILLVLSLVCGSFAVSLRRRLRSKLVRRFGVLWSGDRTAHCPRCEKPLGRYGSYVRFVADETGFPCDHCGGFFQLHDDLGNLLQLADVRERLLRPGTQSN